MTPPHGTLSDGLREAAALYSLGMLEGEVEREFVQHLEVCAVCAAEVRANGEAAAMLSLAGENTPAGELRSRALGAAEYIVSRAGEGEWLPFHVPGIQTKTLARDPVSGTRTFLLRLEPGAVLPGHEHRHAEHCYVLEGEVTDGEHWLRQGDYELRMPGSRHAPVRTETGAVVLIMAAE